MRRLLILTVALVLGAGVFAKGSMTASAPSIAAAIGEFNSMIGSGRRFDTSGARQPISTGLAVTVPAGIDAEQVPHMVHFDASAKGFGEPFVTLDLDASVLILDPSVWTEINGKERRAVLFGSLLGGPGTIRSELSPAASNSRLPEVRTLRSDLTAELANARYVRFDSLASGAHISAAAVTPSDLVDLLVRPSRRGDNVYSPFARLTRSELFDLGGYDARPSISRLGVAEFKSVRSVTDVLSAAQGPARLASRTAEFHSSGEQSEAPVFGIAGSLLMNFGEDELLGFSDSEARTGIQTPSRRDAVKGLLASDVVNREFSVGRFAATERPAEPIFELVSVRNEHEATAGPLYTIREKAYGSSLALNDRSSIAGLASGTRFAANSALEKRFFSRSFVSDLFAGRAESILASVNSGWAISPVEAEAGHAGRSPVASSVGIPVAGAENETLEAPARIIGRLTELAARSTITSGLRSMESGFAHPNPATEGDRMSVTLQGVPAWASSTTAVSNALSLSVTPMTRTNSAPPMVKAATVVTGVPMLNVAPMQKRSDNFCDPNFVGEPIRFSQTAELTLEDFLLQVHNRFGVNFLIGPNVGKLPINIKAGSMPWNILLRSQLFISGVRATCVTEDTVELILNSSVTELEKGRNDAAPLVTEFIKLKYLQPTISANRNVAGQSTQGGGSGGGGLGGGQQNVCQNIGGGGGGGFGGGGGGGFGGGGGGQSIGRNGPQCRYERLISEIEKILGINNQGGFILAPTTVSTDALGQVVRTDAGASPTAFGGTPPKGSLTEIPGRNILVISAGEAQLDRIKKIIELADRPPFQIIIKGLIYTANETKLRDIGVAPDIFATTADGRTSGGIFGDTLGAGGTLFDFSTIIGTVEFAAQATALQENGVISIKSRPFATVLEGDTADLTVGRQVPVLIQAQNSIGGTPGTLQILQAANLLSVTPLIIDDENGNPIAVNLTLQLESNEVDTSVTSQGVPSVSVRSIQSRFILNQQQTAILGGFTVDSDNRTVRKTPGLGDIPILGELFKRRVRSSQVNRLYFAIAVEVVTFPVNPVPVNVPGIDANPPSITPDMKKRSDKAEPKQVEGPKKTGN